MPSERTYAAANVVCIEPCKALAKRTPTAIPSGMLCKVTASTSMVTRCKLDEAPPETADQGGGEGSHCPEKAEKRHQTKSPQLLVAKQIYQIVQTFQ